ncbi:unnamed protein product [Ixodes persulcatus]
MPGCCVPQCTSHNRQGERMFRFPASPNRKRRCLAQVKRGRWETTPASRVCSMHFEDRSFEQNIQDGLKKLRPHAVPTFFPYRAIPKHRKSPKKRACASTAAPLSCPVLDVVASDPDNTATSMRAHASVATPVPDMALDNAASELGSAASFICARESAAAPVTCCSMSHSAASSICARESTAAPVLDTALSIRAHASGSSPVPHVLNSTANVPDNAAPSVCASVSATASMQNIAFEISNEPVFRALSMHTWSTTTTLTLMRRENAELRKKTAI